MFYCYIAIIVHSKISFYNHILSISLGKKTADFIIRAMVAGTALNVNIDMVSIQPLQYKYFFSMEYTTHGENRIVKISPLVEKGTKSILRIRDSVS